MGKEHYSILFCTFLVSIEEVASSRISIGGRHNMTRVIQRSWLMQSMKHCQETSVIILVRTIRRYRNPTYAISDFGRTKGMRTKRH